MVFNVCKLEQVYIILCYEIILVICLSSFRKYKIRTYLLALFYGQRVVTVFIIHTGMIRVVNK